MNDALGEDLTPGSWLRHQRKAARLTQEELAERAGLSVRAVSDLERDARRPYPRSLRLIASALGLPAEASGELIAWYRSGREVRPGQSRRPDFAGPCPAQAGGGPLVVPRQLPAAVASFCGRAEIGRAAGRGRV